MHMLARLALALIVIVFAGLVLFFVLENRQPVSLIFLGWSMPSISVAVLVLGALGIGLVIGPLLGIVMMLKIKGARRSIS